MQGEQEMASSERRDEESRVDKDGSHWPALTGRHLIIANVIWPSFFIPLTFLLYFLADSYELDEIRGVKQIPTISSSGALLPYSTLLTYGLHFQAVLIALIFTAIFVRYRTFIEQYRGFDTEKKVAYEGVDSNDQKTGWLRITLKLMEISNCGCWCSCGCAGFLSRAPTSKTELHRWNLITFTFGMIASFLMSLVGSITLDLNEIAHSTFAFFMFLCGILHMYFFYYKITKIMYVETIHSYSSTLPFAEKIRPWRVWLHQFCVFMSFPFNIAMFVLAGIVYVSCSSLTCQRFSIDLLPATEFSTVIALLLYITQFYEDIRDVNLVAVDTLATSSTTRQQSSTFSTNPVVYTADSHEVEERKFSQENVARQHVIHEV